MKIKSNLVSLLAGAAIGATAVLSIAAAAVSTDASACGRFQLLATDNFIFKIDTATGQVWHTYTSSPSKEFMRANIKTSDAAATNSPPNLEKNPAK
jgi:hypothetical protein